ncbi:MAG: flagellar motor stator protein MotA [Alphaproteobacteria bacterium]
MLVIAGLAFVFLCVLGGYAALGGHVAVLWQPFEFVIIGGAALGAFIMANPVPVLKKSGKAVINLLKGSKYNKKAYIELLSLQYMIFKLAKSKGNLALETHVENPEDSPLFQQFPVFFANKKAVTFLCDYLRLITLGTENAHEFENLVEQELDVVEEENEHIAHALQTMADALPALGIVAAVLGVIKTMGSITEPPEVLGKLIGGALVGTFAGVFMSYGMVGPIAAAVRAANEGESRYFACMKAGMMAFLQGYAPAIAIEFARKSLYSNDRPTFYEVEEATQALPAA